jgi:hypothetical protein
MVSNLNIKNKICIVVVGNCQARPLAMALQSISPRVQILDTVIVHLVNDGMQDDYQLAFDKADLIFAQRVDEAYPCTFVRSAELKKKYPNKIIKWPNLYFTGYSPDFIYLRGLNRALLSGPLSSYHSAIIRGGWEKFLTINQVKNLFINDNFFEEKYGQAAEISLQELRSRELDVDVGLSDWLSERIWSSKLFHTFNHPSNYVIKEMATKLLIYSNLLNPNFERLNGPDIPESLGQIRIPIHPLIFKKNNCNFTHEKDFIGSEVISANNGEINLGYSKKYTIEQLIETYYRVYDHCIR